jgi:hypothetical protein
MVERLSELGITLAVSSDWTAPVTANIIYIWLSLFTLMAKAIRSSDTPAVARATRRHIPEDGILHNLQRSRAEYVGNLVMHVPS